ncbi:MAG: hypothetical protein LBK97_04515 [Prevotellaceae bacterium]|jgi:NACalpha-BTF3-like transcription factor|nr:hypothetical protein [Prevotellaceae bacterium]
MAKKKKKVNLHAQQKIQSAHIRKLYMERLRKLCKLIGNGEQLFDLLPQNVLDAIYKSRGAALCIRVEDGVKITKRFIKMMYCNLEHKMKEELIELMQQPDGVVHVNLFDYYQVVLPLEFILRAKEWPFKGKEKFEAFCVTYVERFTEGFEKFMCINRVACLRYSSISRRIIYTCRYELYNAETVRKRQSFVMTYGVLLGICRPEMRYVDICGERCQIFQSIDIDYDNNVPFADPTTIAMKRLNKKESSDKKTLPVYIRQQAIDLVMQQVSLSTQGSVQALIHCSFEVSGKVIRESNKYLVECYYGRVKIGYFVGMIVDGLFVITSFRLITHHGTPEGREVARLVKSCNSANKDFLAVDDKNIPAELDMLAGQNLPVMLNEMIEDKSIFEIGNKIFNWFPEDTEKDPELAKLLDEYIQLGDSDEDYYEND